MTSNMKARRKVRRDASLTGSTFNGNVRISLSAIKWVWLLYEVSLSNSPFIKAVVLITF